MVNLGIFGPALKVIRYRLGHSRNALDGPDRGAHGLQRAYNYGQTVNSLIWKYSSLLKNSKNRKKNQGGGACGSLCAHKL